MSTDDDLLTAYNLALSAIPAEHHCEVERAVQAATQFTRLAYLRHREENIELALAHTLFMSELLLEEFTEHNCNPSVGHNLGEKGTLA